ncbi:MAG: helix-turn-helix domain-containing protein [Paludibacteraceae bacterium]|nr:helix-turn-helix domain-containing protein [Paludibacteraceae bacterium]
MKTLQEIAARLPRSTEEMKTIPGLGTKRISKYGDEIISIVRTYLADKREDKLSDEERELIAKSEKKKKSSSAKSGEPDTYHKTLALFKDGKSIEEIATERSLTVSTIENHLSKLVYNCEIDAEKVMDRSFLNSIDKILSKKNDVSIEDIRKSVKGRVSSAIIDIYYHWSSKEKSKIVGARLSANDRKNTVKALYIDNIPLTDIAVRLKEPPTVIADDIIQFVEKGHISEESVLSDSEYKKIKKVFASLPEDGQYMRMMEVMPLNVSRVKVKIAWKRYTEEHGG